uniref:Uncharacterized protein n=1 Tax=Ditylenchus dipsaci TaxID=166011 RepID=A0A915CLP7_9BILA
MLIHLVWVSFALPLVFSSVQQVNWKRAKRQHNQACSCVSQYTPVNCKCQAANGPGGELLCRCDRAAVLSHPLCSNCPTHPTPNHHVQSIQQPVPPIYTPPPTQSASYVASMCQPICRQNCIQTCNAANNYHQVPFTATGQHHFSSYSTHQSSTPQCQPSQCQYTCKRACSQGRSG